jgi:hypothetical protein
MLLLRLKCKLCKIYPCESHEIEVVRGITEQGMEIGSFDVNKICSLQLRN